MKAAAAIVGGVLLAAVIVFVGPKETAICESVKWPNSVFGDMFAHTDGASYTGCDVPTGVTWALAGAALLAPIVATIAVALDRRERERQP